MSPTPPAGFDDGGDQALRPHVASARLLKNAAHLYRLRVREQPLQELLALLGIAAGVALLFAVQVASTSVTGAVEELAHGISGEATIELAARGPGGMNQQVVAEALRQPSVQAVAPALLQRVTVEGPRGSQPLTLFGVDQRLEKIGGPLVRQFAAKHQDLDALGLFLTSTSADAVGAVRGQAVTIQSGDQSREVPLYGSFSTDEVGGLASSPVALAPLGQAQRLVDSPGRISRVLVVPKPGEATQAQHELRNLAAGRFDVRQSNSEVHLLAQALKPDEQSSVLFSAIAVVIGMLFAYNAMLLSAPGRRRTIAYLRMLGAGRSTVIATLIFDALMLGVVASIVGIVLGNILSILVFQSVPGYLASGFPIGSQRVVTASTVALSIAGGLAAALLASAKPAIDLLRVSPGEVIEEPAAPRHSASWLSSSLALWSGLTMVAVTSVLVWLAPSTTPVAIAVLLVALGLVVGPVITFALTRLSRVTRVNGGPSIALAVHELAANITRATAVAVIAAAAMAATLSIGGTRQDLERGVEQLNRDFYSKSQLWVTTQGPSNTFLTQQFDPEHAVERLRGTHAVHSINVNRGAFLDFDKWRLRVYAPPAEDSRPLVLNQIVRGSPELATKRIRAGGWITLSQAVAQELRRDVGDQIKIPTPSGNRSFRIAAITANYGWPSGTIVLNGDDFTEQWRTTSATVLGVQLKSGIASDVAQEEIQRALGPNSNLIVRTPGAMVAERTQVTAQGLARLRQIAALVLASSILAIVAAMFAAVWQRRTRLASLRTIGMYRSELYRTLFLETALIVFIGGVIGLVFGFYFQLLGTGWTELSSGYQTIFKPAIGLGFETLAKVMALATLATIGPAYLASRIAPQTGEIE